MYFTISSSFIGLKNMLLSNDKNANFEIFEILRMTSFFANVGRIFLNFLQGTGHLIIFINQTITMGIRPPYYSRQILKQIINIGYFSLPVVGLTAMFTGMVLALQSYTGFARFSAEGAVATVVVLSITRELAPVLAGLMVAGRIGAVIAAELGTMRVTEQIDALSTLSTDPLQYLVMPRVIAGIFTLPLLVLVADIIGVFGGYLVSIYKLGFNPGNYLHQTLQYLKAIDVISGLIKASVFGFCISIMGCYHGYYSKGGAQGVGSATTNAVVSSSILILIFNYLLTAVFFDK